MPTYIFTYKNITRELPVYEVGAEKRIAYLDTMSDFELVTALSRDMAAQISANEKFSSAPRVVLLTAESKGVPFAYSVASSLSARGDKTVDIVIARKKEKKFFGHCIYAEKTSITTERESERLLITEDDGKKLKNAEVILVDDVYSTGASMNALEALANRCNAEIIDKAVAIWETTDINNKPDVKYVTTLPLL